MNARHSDSLILIWRLAEFEARLLNAHTIEPAHLLLGLCKSVDVDLAALLRKRSSDRGEMLEELRCEVRRLRTLFESACLDARKFRRALRRLSEKGGDPPPESHRLRRSSAAKEVFSDAEHLAELADHLVFPVHLLYAVLSIKDEVRDNLMGELGVSPERLRKVTKREVMLRRVCDRSHVGRN
jgi:ATP-dependent Clp protease ATP-binding subunit ClpC